VREWSSSGPRRATRPRAFSDPAAKMLILLGLFGAARRSRTPNLQIRSLSLYPVELWLHVHRTCGRGILGHAAPVRNPPYSMRPVIGEEAEA
jgi:hypothetical protein